MGDELENETAVPAKWSKLRQLGLWLLGIVALLVFGVTLQREFGIQFDTTYRIACAGLCLLFIYKLGADFGRERWNRVSLWLALLANIGIFFTPLVDRPASRGELLLFALPDAVIVLASRIVSYRVTNVHQRATRQTMILGLVVAIIFCFSLFALTWLYPHTAQANNQYR